MAEIEVEVKQGIYVGTNDDSHGHIEKVLKKWAK